MIHFVRLLVFTCFFFICINVYEQADYILNYIKQYPTVAEILGASFFASIIVLLYAWYENLGDKDDNNDIRKGS